MDLAKSCQLESGSGKLRREVVSEIGSQIFRLVTGSGKRDRAVIIIGLLI